MIFGGGTTGEDDTDVAKLPARSDLSFNRPISIIFLEFQVVVTLLFVVSDSHNIGSRMH